MRSLPKASPVRKWTLEEHANAALMRDERVLWDCARELFFTRCGGATIEAEAAWSEMSDADRAVFAMEAVAIQREYSKTLSHLPAPTFQTRKERGPLLSG